MVENANLKVKDVVMPVKKSSSTIATANKFVNHSQHLNESLIVGNYGRWTVVRNCLKLTHCHWLNLSETLATRSYGATFPRVSGASERSVAERVSGRALRSERASEQVALFPQRRFWTLLNHSTREVLTHDEILVKDDARIIAYW